MSYAQEDRKIPLRERDPMDLLFGIEPTISPQNDYGTAPNKRAKFAGALFPAVLKPGKRARLNLLAILLNIFAPSLLFTALFALMSFSFHFKHPTLAWTIVLFALAAVLAMAADARYERLRAQGGLKEPMWFNFTVASLLFAWTVGTVSGNANYYYNMEPFYGTLNMNNYPSIDPSRDSGSQLSDAGIGFFADGVGLDRSRAMSFKADDLYCVTPIVNGDQPPRGESYDFWAVGLNCCGELTSDFRCGEFQNPHARSGLRLVSAYQRRYYRLAVQQAEAAFGIQAKHPIFFYWLQDPVAEMNRWEDDGIRYFVLGSFVHFFLNLFFVATATIAFSKIGRG